MKNILENIQTQSSEVGLPLYEQLDQYEFEDMVINRLKEVLLLTTRKAVHKYEEICSEVSVFDERCKTENNMYSTRKYIISKLSELGIDIKETSYEKNKSPY